jgi:hypothetical protein
MQITNPTQALNLPHGTLEVVRETQQGRVCDICTFTDADVINTARKLLDEKVELVDFVAQAELMAYMTNQFGWKGYREAFAI